LAGSKSLILRAALTQFLHQKFRPSLLDRHLTNAVTGNSVSHFVHRFSMLNYNPKTYWARILVAPLDQSQSGAYLLPMNTPTITNRFNDKYETAIDRWQDAHKRQQAIYRPKDDFESYARARLARELWAVIGTVGLLLGFAVVMAIVIGGMI
jgi:hypothetical protein